MTPYGRIQLLVNISSGNGPLPSGTKSSPTTFWLITSEVPWKYPQVNLTENAQYTYFSYEPDELLI